MFNFRRLLAICVVLLATAGLTPRSHANSIIYESIPAYCSGCGGFSEYVDSFTLSNSYVIDQVNFVTGPTQELSGFGVQIRIWNDDRSNIIFSQPLIIGQTGTPDFGTFILTAELPEVSLTAGSYWISFWAFNLGIPGFAGGNGSGGNSVCRDVEPVASLRPTTTAGTNYWENLLLFPFPQPFLSSLAG